MPIATCVKYVYDHDSNGMGKKDVRLLLYLLRFLFQKLCDYVSELLLEESNVQPVSSPVTVCGDIHGQVGHNLQFIAFID